MVSSIVGIIDRKRNRTCFVAETVVVRMQRRMRQAQEAIERSWSSWWRAVFCESDEMGSGRAKQNFIDS